MIGASPASHGKFLTLCTFTLLIVSLATSACRPESSLCEKGLCPVGTRCNATSGQCDPCNAATGICGPGESSALGPVGAFGHATLLRLGGGGLGAVVYDAGHKSLVLLESGDTGWTPTFIAGPSAAADEPAAGQSSAATVGADGRIHVVWLRQADATLWYGVGSSGGWHREQIMLAAAGSVGRPMAIGLWLDVPTIAYRDNDIHGIRLARRDAAGSWKSEVVPAPAPRSGQSSTQTDLGRSLAMAIMPAGPAITAYDATGGDLVLAVRSAGGWDVARIAGSDPATGADTGDMGDPSAVALGPAGELAVAYRNRSSGQVLVARSKSGVISHQVVASAARSDKASGAQRIDLLGTALAILVQPSGRAVVAMQDASRIKVRIAVESPGGTFATVQDNGLAHPREWPSLLARADGSVVAAAVRLDPSRGPAGGTLEAWTVPTAGAP